MSLTLGLGLGSVAVIAGLAALVFYYRAQALAETKATLKSAEDLLVSVVNKSRETYSSKAEAADKVTEVLQALPEPEKAEAAAARLRASIAALRRK